MKYPTIDSDNRIREREQLQKYLYGGSGTVLLVSPSGKHHAYVVSLPRSAEFPDDVRFVYTLTHDLKLFYIGMVELGKFRTTKSSRFIPENEITKGAAYLIRMAFDDKTFNGNMEVYHSGRCTVCGRKLANPSSLRRGAGRRCMKYVESRCKNIR